jgi:hypothetical protein
MNPVKTAVVTTAYVFRHRANRAALPVFLISLAVFIAVFFLAWLPAAVAVAGLKKAVNSVLEEKKNTEAAIQFIKEYADAKDLSSAAVKKLSNISGAGDISKKINSLAANAGLKFSLENTGNKNERVAGYEVIIQDIAVAGSYKGLRAFLYGLENSEVFAVIRKVRIDREGKIPGNIKAGIQLALYVKPVANGDKQ